jgi:hypothetical protein
VGDNQAREHGAGVEKSGGPGSHGRLPQGLIEQLEAEAEEAEGGDDAD